MLGAEVTFDVALPKIIWGWLVSTNMWAKSIATGSFMLALIATRINLYCYNIIGNNFRPTPYV